MNPQCCKACQRKHASCDAPACHWQVEAVMIEMGLLANILWGIFIITLFWTGNSSDNLEVNHLWVPLQEEYRRQNASNSLIQMHISENWKPGFLLTWELLTSVAGT